jgi:hypothetical protein
MPPANREQLDREKVIACVKNVDGLSYKGEPLVDVEDIVTRFPWIYEQITAGIADRANFMIGLLPK